MKMHWDGRKCFLRFIRGTTQLDRHDAYPLCAGARTCFLDNGRTRLSLPAPPIPPASLRKSALRGDLSSGSLDRAHTLPGSLSKACPAPSPSLRIPIHYSHIFPFLQGGFANFPRRHQRLCLWTPAGLCPAPAKGLRPSRHPFAIELSFLSYCFRVFMRGFRLCGGDQRALRSPSGLLRSTLQCYLIFIVAGGFAPVGATRGQRRRYPFLKYSPLCCTIPSAFCTIAGRRCWVMSASITS